MTVVDKAEVKLQLSLDKGSFGDGVTYARDTGKKLNEALKSKLQLDVAQFQTQLATARQILASAKKSMDQDAIIKAQLSVNALQGNVTEAKRLLNNYLNTGNTNLSRFQRSIDSVGASFKGMLANAVGFTAITALVKKVVDLGANLEQTTIAFETMLGSAEAAQTMLRQLSDFAKSTPFDIVGVRDVAKQLLAMGVDSSNLIGTLKALGDVAAGLSVPMDRLALAYGQVLAKGRLQGGELRQFTEAGVPIVAELAKNLGVAQSAIADMVEAGQISAVDVTKAFQTMTAEGGKFGNLMEKQSRSFKGIMSNIGDTLTRVGEQIGSALVPKLSEAASGILDVVNEYSYGFAQLFTDAFNTITEIIAQAVKGFTELFNVLVGNTNKAAEQQVSFGEVVYAVFKAILLGFQVIVKGISGLGAVVGTTLGVVFTNVSAFITDAVNLGIKAINKLAEASNRIAGTSFGMIDLFSDKPKANFGAEIKNTLGDIAKEFEGLDYSLKLPQNLLKTPKLNTSINLDKITNTKKDDKGKGGNSAAKKEKEEQDRRINILEEAAEKEKAIVLAGKTSYEAKAIAVKAIENKLALDILKVKGNQADIEKEQNKQALEYEKIYADVVEKRMKKIKDIGATTYKAIEDAMDDSKKAAEDLNKEIDETKDKLKDIDEQIAGKILDIRKEMADLNKKQTSGQGWTEDEAERYRELSKQMELSAEDIQHVSQADLDAAQKRKDRGELGELFDKRNDLATKQAELMAKAEVEKQIQADLQQAKIELEQAYTAAYGVELKKQDDMLTASINARIAKYRELATAQAMTTGAGGGGNTSNNTTNTTNVIVKDNVVKSDQGLAKEIIKAASNAQKDIYVQ